MLRKADTREEERPKQEPSIPNGETNGETETSSMNGARAYSRGEERPNAGCLLKRKWMKPTSLMEGSRQQRQTGEGAGSRIRPFSPSVYGFLHIRHSIAPYSRLSRAPWSLDLKPTSASDRGAARGI